MTRKSQLKELISRAQFDPDCSIQDFTVIYRDMDSFVEDSLENFLKLSETESVPLHRVKVVKKQSETVWYKTGHCPICGIPECVNHT